MEAEELEVGKQASGSISHNFRYLETISLMYITRSVIYRQNE
jgi:hypothetical protein